MRSGHHGGQCDRSTVSQIAERGAPEMAESDDITLWKHLAEESKAGRLDLDPSIATDCLKACEDQLDVYKECQSLVKQAEHVTGLGDFPASDQLAKMLSLKAVGGE